MSNKSYMRPGSERMVEEIMREADALPKMSPEDERRSRRHGMLKRWADEELFPDLGRSNAK